MPGIKVWVRDTQWRRAARRARSVATRFQRTLYLGCDAKTGEYIAISYARRRKGYGLLSESRLDPHFGMPPIVPRGHYWEASLIAEGRSPWT